MKILALQLAWWTGLYSPPDRALLETVILPHYRDRRMLFVGTRFYTRRYPRLAPRMVTLDPDPRMARFGAREHFVMPIERFSGHRFDVVIINGVFGWGINDEATAAAALDACRRALNENGELVIGFNQSRCPPLDLRPFRPHIFPPLGAPEVTVATPFAEKSHTYKFFTT